ncbi:putative DNA modification/repair radical SAM protein [Vallitalea okinawensis]|uniref:putative DNA modification/repair radical SAM protein n=1 Tax=Vallitalea okinawensis TaxID=2078660 RepID=UPI000CFBFE35|nr:putative DNA modification/repair radical SAM protein [Vallitalea okinawensis]
MIENALDKLKILADAAKYDVSCASSGADKKNNGKIGNSIAAGICHAWSTDGRCISLLKILLTNYCVYDCSYCINRVSNDVQRASFTPEEVADLTIQFYRRNYIEGLFLSSAIEKNPNHTMEKIYRTLYLLREEHGFSGYIHVKTIPGADPMLIHKTGQLADRMSVNIELPSTKSLKLLAPQKSVKKLMEPMEQINNGIIQYKEEKRHFIHLPKFVPAGQSTQMIIGATKDTDLSIIHTTEKLYNSFNLKRVYFSAYVPVNTGSNLPSLATEPPLKREHRLYQADWLLRFYHFNAEELLDPSQPNFDMEFDPKMTWAFRNMETFPVEINKAPYEMLLRVPGIGMTSARRIIRQRQIANISYDHLNKIGIVMKRAKFFITCNGKFHGQLDMNPEGIKEKLAPKPKFEQLSIFS